MHLPIIIPRKSYPRPRRSVRDHGVSNCSVLSSRYLFHLRHVLAGLRPSVDLKNSTDDALPNYLTSLRFQQSHSLTDVRLALGYSAVVIAGITFYFDYTLGWDETKQYTLWAVVAYFILNGALTLWIFLVEKGKIFHGSSKTGALVCWTTSMKRGEAAFIDTVEQLTMVSSVTKHTPIYKLTVRWTNPETSDTSIWQTREISAPFTTWFSTDGHFIAKPFQQWLAAEVPVIGEADEAHASKKIIGVQPASTRDLGESSGASLRSRKG